MRIHFEKNKYINRKNKMLPGSNIVQPRKKGEKFMFYSLSSSDVEKWDTFVFIKVWWSVFCSQAQMEWKLNIFFNLQLIIFKTVSFKVCMQF